MNAGKPKLDGTFTDPETLEGIIRRFKRIEGQVRGLQRMAEEGRSFSELLDQIQATRKALDSVASVVLEEYLNAWETQAASGNVELSKGQIAMILRKVI
ncbi:MAG: metal-sensitive transcriptional regulator [Meiothermus sp.]|uniref:metal-sensitive transcriptional regulator n=1 Tax=Meiothermus sp. TaxID=1955249 RepID=UPI0025CEF765|nr:metal-sensitive transcriptional regulator [Meiothermus sp.]MCS7067846.1 metal-sensitive transcriptional regulator [Meiothermus sp.]MCX7600589.1 metal-sensitive transcriptional regulator [Meiothermus sp.]MDW8424764.1 metal-sensitive transcriptional regulator [Meiothermus sp.]